MSHALVIGGTGMLRGVCLTLARRGWTVSVVARRHAGLSALAAEAEDGRINPLPVDYRDGPELAARIRAAVAAQGRVRLAVCWIHSVAPEAPGLVAAMIADERAPVPCFHVLGTAADRSDPASIAGILYRRITLGFVVEAGASRWLTNDEIARGVMDAIDRGAARSIVGAVEPRSARPVE